MKHIQKATIETSLGKAEISGEIFRELVNMGAKVKFKMSPFVQDENGEYQATAYHTLKIPARWKAKIMLVDGKAQHLVLSNGKRTVALLYCFEHKDH